MCGSRRWMIRLGLAVASLLALFGAHELYAAYFDTESNAANSITTDMLGPADLADRR